MNNGSEQKRSAKIGCKVLSEHTRRKGCCEPKFANFSIDSLNVAVFKAFERPWWLLQTQADLSEFKASLVYIASSRSARDSETCFKTTKALDDFIYFVIDAFF